MKTSLYAWCVAGLILSALLLRIVLLSLGWPVTNSDEAFMDLAALHIKNGVDYPIWFYGQYYLGPIESYMGALMFSIFGVSVWSMRIGLLIFYGGFLLCMAILVRLIYNKSLALIMLVLLALGTEVLIPLQMNAFGYASLPFLCSLLFLLSYLLVSKQRARKIDACLFFLWGLVAGVILWVHLVMVPYVLVSGLLLLLWRWKMLLKWAGWLVLAGLVLGAFPLIFSNLTALPGQDSLSVFLKMSQLGATNHYPPEAYVTTTPFIVLPALLGLYPRCYITQAPFAISDQPHARLCFTLQSLYGTGYIVLSVIALLLVSLAIWRIWMQRKINLTDQTMLVRQSARFMLLVGMALTIIVFARNSNAVYSGVEGLRYIECTLISLPAVLYPLIAPISWRKRTWKRMLINIGCCGLILALCATSLKATSNIFDSVAPALQDDQRYNQLENRLGQLHITRFYSDYWTCNRLIFQTQEKLICSNTRDNFTHGFDRYVPYRAMVDADPNPGFVYPKGSNLIHVLEQALTATHTPYRRLEVASFVIYQPAHRIPGVKLYQN